MKTFLLCVIVLSLAKVAWCDTPVSQPVIRMVKAIAPPAHRADVATCVTVVKDGAVIAGYTTDDASNEDGLIERINDAGDVIWRREVGGAKEDDLWAIQPDGAGGFVCAGYTSSSGAGASDGWPVRVNEKGDVSWQKTFGAKGDDKFWSLARDGDDWLAVGETEGRGAGGLDALVVRIDKMGNEIASFTTGTQFLDRAFSIVPMTDGGFAIGGMTGKDRDHSFAFISRHAKDGTVIWRRVFEDAGFGVVHDLHLTANDALVGVGYAQTKDHHDPDGLILRLSANGHVTSQRTFGGANADRSLHAAILGDNSTMIVGYIQRSGKGNPDARWDIAVWQLDQTDTLISTQRFGGNNTEFGRAIAGDKSNLWIVGHSLSFGRSSVYVLRLSA